MTGDKFTPPVCQGYPYRMEVYLASGKVEVIDQGDVQLRAVIELTDWDVDGRLCSIRLWAKGEKGLNLKGTFTLSDTGEVYPNEFDKKLPMTPPHSMAFWKFKEAQSPTQSLEV